MCSKFQTKFKYIQILPLSLRILTMPVYRRISVLFRACSRSRNQEYLEESYFLSAPYQPDEERVLRPIARRTQMAQSPPR